MQSKNERLKRYLKFVPALLVLTVVITMVIADTTSGKVIIMREQYIPLRPNALTSDITVTATPCIPDTANITQSAASDISDTGATLNGNLIDDGCCSVNISWRWDTSDKGESDNWTYTANYTGVSEGSISHEIASGLVAETQYFSIIQASNCEGVSWSSTVNWTTEAEAILPPTDLEAIDTGGYTVNLTWTKGLNAINTYIVMKRGSYPDDLSDGDTIYSGNGTSTQVTGLELDADTWYFKAYSEASGVYSTDYDTASVGGSGMTHLAIIGVCGLFLYFATRRGSALLVRIGSVAAWVFWMYYYVNNPPFAIRCPIGVNL